MPRAGTIAVASGSVLSYQGAVTFDSVVTSPLKGYEYPMIYVKAFDVDSGDLIYGQLDHPDAVFVLGGGSSVWVSRGGGPARCEADLMIYGGRHNIADPFVASVGFSATA